MASGLWQTLSAIVIASVPIVTLCEDTVSVFTPTWRATYPRANDVTSGIPGVNTYNDCATLESNVTRSGNYSIQHKLSKADPDRAGSKRCESDSMAMKGSRIKRGQTQYYGFSLYLPETWSFDNKRLIDILFQWKGFGGGPFAMLVQKYQGLYLRASGGHQFEITRTVELGKWHDIRVMIHWEVNESGVIELDYKMADVAEYSRVVSFNGATMDRDAGGYLKWGIYKPVWKSKPKSSAVASRTIWHDNIAVGDSWDDVDPSQPVVRRLETQGLSAATLASAAPAQAGISVGVLLV